MSKLKVGIIGSGNIGTDLMYKIERCDYLQMSVMIGIDPASEGLREQKSADIKQLKMVLKACVIKWNLVDIVFDATSAYAHEANYAVVKAAGKRMIDLTPAAIGPFTVPTVNLMQHFEDR